MRIYSVMFGSATFPLSLPSLTIRRGAATLFAAGVGLPRSGRYVARFVEIIVFAILLALMALPAPARAQTFTISSVTASPATVQPGQTVTFSATISASQNASNYPVEFSLIFNGKNVTQKIFYLTFRAGAISVQAYSWSVPGGTAAGTYSMEVAVFNPTWSSTLAMKSAALTIAAATVGDGAAGAPVLLQLPVVSGTAQVGHALASTTGTWTGATSFAYQWSGNKAPITGATAATYVPVSSDVGHTLTSTVVATGSSGAKSSATSAATVPIVAATPNSPPPPVSGSVPFVALHKYYMSPTGSDSNNGLTAATAWATPNHAVNCGDVIIAAAGSYASMSHWGTVGSCPSTSGGIDGTGGVYFATVLCAGPDVGACSITTKATATAFEVTASNWAVEGWYVNTAAKYRAFETYACTFSGGMKHHVAFINDISANNLDGMGTNECGQDVPSTAVPSPVGTDYVAAVGMIAQNSAQDPICLAAIDVVAPGVLDTKAGTHYFIAGNFSYANVNSHCRSVTDTEDFMADTWDAHNVTTQGVFANNIGFGADRMCIQTYWQNKTADAATIKIYNNTCFQNNNYNGDNLNGEINIAASAKPIPWIITVQNNLAYQPLSISGGGGRVAAFALYDTITSFTNIGNFFRANNTKCTAVYCNSTFDAQTWGAVATLGTNTYTNPAFTNTADLLANRAGVPNCNAFANTTQCMGWNANTSVMTKPSIISDLTPTASGTAGKGYQLPSTACAANADYPTWLKGIVYLQWNGSSLSENSGLITKPCNM